MAKSKKSNLEFEDEVKVKKEPEKETDFQKKLSRYEKLLKDNPNKISKPEKK